ncbi:MAG TPA: DUF2249 domain-containing protein [Terriglobales bacterium]|nr:DUF2249 domain-containing protein [Terriglobales bacterium]
MNSINLNDFNDFNDNSIGRRTLFDDPVLGVLAVSLKAGQGLPQHAADGLVTIYGVSGKVHLWNNNDRVEVTPGTLVRLLPGAQHRLEAEATSQLLVTLIRPSDPAIWNSLAPQGQDLDLRQTPRPRRHSTIFYAFDQLAVGESFFIVNDHDPQPLRMQIEQAHPGEMAWEYEKREPEMFRIRVSRVAAAPTAS